MDKRIKTRVHGPLSVDKGVENVDETAVYELYIQPAKRRFIHIFHTLIHKNGTENAGLPPFIHSSRPDA